MSLQGFTFTFSKAGTVWADDCAKGTSVSSFTNTYGELEFFSSLQGEKEKVTLIKFIEEGDQITFVYTENKYKAGALASDPKYFTTIKASLAGGVWRTLYMEADNQILIQNGLILLEGADKGKKMRPMNQCAQTSTAYRKVFPPKISIYEAKMIWGMNRVRGGCDEECLEAKRIYPGEYEKYIIEYENYHANKARATERAKRECATAGDIDRCIRIKLGLD